MTRKVAGKWRSAGSAKASLVAGKYSYTFKPRYKGDWRFVAAYAGSSSGLTTYRSSKSKVKAVKVK